MLRIDADLDQRTEAWYNLSLVTDDPVEKRNYLENVLAAYPNHAEARRDMAILEGRLDPSAIVDLRSPVGPVVPGETLSSEEVQRFRCSRCGGRMQARGDRGDLWCQFCGHSEPLNAPSSEQVGARPNSDALEQDWYQTIFTRRGHTWEVPTKRIVTCGGCGATVTLPPSNISGDCPFCGAPFVVLAPDLQLLQPDAMAPFRVDADAARQAARDWLAAQRFRPRDLDHTSALSQPRGIYLPFWTFDITGEIHWRGYAARSAWSSSDRTPITGSVPVLLDDILVPGTRSLPPELLKQLTYNKAAMLPYAPELLANHAAEIYSISLSDAAVEAHEIAFHKSDPRSRPEAVAEVDGVSEVEITGRNITIDSYKHILLPVWVLRYTYTGKEYMLLVEATEGAACGEVPRTGVQSFLNGLFSKG